MTLPENVIEASVLICEKTLREDDGVFSIIRLVDIFFVTLQPGTPRERLSVKMSVLFRVKVADDTEHVLKLVLQRPSGAEAAIAEAPPAKATSQFVDVPGGISGVAHVGVLAKEMGTHYFKMLLDDVEVARTPFTLRERSKPVESEEPQP